jgi:hypothetical protein
MVLYSLLAMCERHDINPEVSPSDSMPVNMTRFDRQLARDDASTPSKDEAEARSATDLGDL